MTTNLRAFALISHLTIAAAAILLAASPAARAQTSVDLNSGWQLQDIAKATDAPEQISGIAYHTNNWYKATVPGTVLTSLVDDGVYPEPLYGENNRPDKIPESLCRTSYWYRKTFDVPKSYRDKQIWLNFTGINYRAEVWVNGHHAGDIAGAFARGTFDVSKMVTIGKPNAMAVKILPQPHPGTPIEQTISRGVGPNGGVTAMDGPTFLCAIGWDWIPGIRDRDMGIWQGVTLSATGAVVVEDPYVTSELPLPRTDSADMTVEATVRNVTDKPQSGLVQGAIDGLTFQDEVKLGPRESRKVVFTPATSASLHVEKPRLWWPNGYGAPNLYPLNLRFVIDKQISDEKSIHFGIRKITYEVPGSENLTISVNGVPVLCKGGDWGMDEALKRIPASRLDAQVRMHRDANFAMIRNWVGQSTSEDFYNACDKYGILLWDEMFQPNPGDGPNAADLDLYLANVREKLLRFRSHPSIAVWCARNEGFPPANIDAGIQKLMAELEHGRLYQRSSTSGRGVHSSGPYYWRAPRDFYNVDAPFKTEIGTVSIPTLESIEGMMPAKDWNVINDDWAEHDLASGAQGGDRFPVQMAARYGPIANLADFARKGQMASYEAFRAMFEGRQAKLFAPVTGVLTWMSNPSQPSFVWQIYSHDLEPCAALFASQLACEPIHIQMNESNEHVEIINNTPKSLNGLTERTTVYSLDGKVIYNLSGPADARPSAATDLGAIAFPANLSQVHFVKLILADASGEQLSQNFYWRGAPDAPDDFRALATLPTVTVEATAEKMERYAGDGSTHLEVTLHNPASTPVLMAHLQLRRAKSNVRVLPVYYSDNFVSLLPGETRTIHIAAADADLHGDEPRFVVDGWNLRVQNVAKQIGLQVKIGPNENADYGTPVAATAAAPRAATGFALNIDCGGGGSGFYAFGESQPEAGRFVADRDFVGGKESGVGDAIVTAGVVHAAPESVYKSERWGPSVYTIRVPKLTTGHSYTVRLHFADTTFDTKGARQFNVALNGVRRLTDLDIVAESGGKGHALVKEFTGLAPNQKGQIVIELTNGAADQPEIRGIEVAVAEGAPVAVPVATTSTVSAENAPAPTKPNVLETLPSWSLGTFIKEDAANPILSPLPTTFTDPISGMPVAWEHDHTFNPAAVVRDGKVCVIYRAEDNSGDGIGHHASRLGLAESEDGLHFTRRTSPIFYPDNDAQKDNESPGGCEDPRIVETADGRYVLTYTQWNRKVARLAVATSTDLIHWQKHGPVFAKAFNGRFADLFCKSGAIVTRQSGDHLIAVKINGKYWMLWGEGSIHAATSDDLLDWTPILDDKNELKAVFGTRRGKFDSNLVEGGPPCVLTDKGIVMLYNSKNGSGDAGDKTLAAGSYSAGMALLDANDPTKLLDRTESCFFTPEKPYERTGQYAAGTTFIEGLVPFKGRWFLYYGTADSFVAVAATKGM